MQPPSADRIGLRDAAGAGGGVPDLTLPGAHYAGRVINGGHVIIYSRDAEADRVFFRDILGCPSVDAGAGWLIFRLPPAEIAVHPVDGAPAHELYLMCDDLDATMAELASKGVGFTAITEVRWGRLTALRLPSGGEVGLYEPRHIRATDL